MRSHDCPGPRAWRISWSPAQDQYASAFSPPKVSCRRSAKCGSSGRAVVAGGRGGGAGGLDGEPPQATRRVTVGPARRRCGRTTLTLHSGEISEAPRTKGDRHPPMELRIEGLSKRYPTGIQALRDVTLSIRPGMFGLLGPNGAGKSTLMRTLATLQEPDAGKVTLGAIDV